MPFFQFPRDWFLLHSGQVLHRQWDETVTINMTKACSQIHRVVAQLTATGFRSHRLQPIQGQALDHPLFSSLQQNFHVFKHTASNKACSKCLIDDIQWHKKFMYVLLQKWKVGSRTYLTGAWEHGGALTADFTTRPPNNSKDIIPDPYLCQPEEHSDPHYWMGRSWKML
jgi:hypothetical protein